MQTLWQDLRYGARMLCKKPGFTLIAVLSLALGIGANTAIFSLVNTMFLRPLPVERPQELVALNSVSLNGERSFPTFSVPNYRDLRDRNDVLAGLAAYRIAPISLSNHGVNTRLWGYLATGNYFALLGVKPALGRFFTPEDDRTPGAHPVAVITHDCWQRRFGGAPDVVGQSVLVNARSYTIIGVAGPGFYGTEVGFKAELWFPLMMLAQIEASRDYLNDRDTFNFFVLGRLKPGVTAAQAEAALKNIAAQLAREFPKENAGNTIALSPPGLFGAFMRGPVMGFAGVLLAVVGLVLLLACTNLANLLLARAAERRKEIAIRLALGAGRGRLVRQLLTESVMLAALGGAAGLALAYWLLNAATAFQPPLDIPLTTELQLDARVLLFAVAVSLLTGVVFGLLPAWQATKPQLVPALKDEASLGGYRRSWLRSGLVVLQIALSLVLLICAGLVLRGLQNAQRLSPGIVTQGAVELSFDLGLQGYDGGRIKQFKQQILTRARALPGVQAVGLSDIIPLSMNMNNNSIYLEGQPAPQGANVPLVLTSRATSGFLQALGTPLLQGRDFTEQETEANRHVAIVNETFARRFWPGQSALGKRFSFDAAGSSDSPSDSWIEIVGLIPDGKYFSLSEESQPFIYVNLRPDSGSFLTLVARGAGESQTLLAALRREFQQLDANLPVYNAKTLTQHMAVPLFPARVAASLLGSFGLLALLLAAIGIFGVMSYAVTQRTRELGIRIALGASAANIFRLVVGHGVMLTALGLGLGLTAAAAGTRLLSGLLYGVSALDAVTFAGVSLLLALVALLACYFPARRAMRVDPLIALRTE